MRKSGVIALSALLFATSLSAFAERPDGPPPVKHEQQHGNPQPDQHRAPQQQAHPDEHRHGPHQEFRKGRPLAEKYRGEGYQVNDWHKRGLKAPPAGHRWQNIDGNYVLIAVATGAIVSVIAHH